MQKAFDNVNHDILLSKQNHYSTRRSAFDWFKGNLSDRTQYYAVINNQTSEIKTIKFGAAQTPS